MPPDVTRGPMRDGCRSTLTHESYSTPSRSSQYSTKSLKYPEPLRRLAAFIHHRKCKDIIVMAGAGISTASGIPDFRSPGTGLYYNTKKYNVSRPTDVFDLQYFLRNPHPFLDIIRDFIETEKQPNIIHSFCKMLESRGQLLRMYTQNIDGLEKKSGISATRLVEAHGTLDSASCCKCFSAYSSHWTIKMILEKRVPNCRKKGCSGFVKPDIVMFGEELPKKFYLYPKDFERCDLLIVMGTSLNVEPFSELVNAVSRRTPRILLNWDAVGPFSGKRRKNDIFIKGDIGSNIRQLLALVGWRVEEEEERGEEGSGSEADSNTWASSRTAPSVLGTGNIKPALPAEPLCVPNSVARKSSQHNLTSKMSGLTLATGQTRRSVSAPLTKSEMKSPDVTLPAVTPVTSEMSAVTVVNLPGKAASTRTIAASLQQTEGAPPSKPNKVQSSPPREPSPIKEITRTSPLVNGSQSPVEKPASNSSAITPENSALIPAADSVLEITSIPSEISSLQESESLSTETSVLSTEVSMSEIGERDDNDNEEKHNDKEEEGEQGIEERITLESAPADLEQHSFDNTILVSNPPHPVTTVSDTKAAVSGAPKKTRRSGTVLNRPANLRTAVQPRPLYKLKRQPQNVPLPTSGKLTSTGRIQSSGATPANLKKVGKVRSYSNLFAPDTSEVFKRELNDFISHRARKAVKERREKLSHPLNHPGPPTTRYPLTKDGSTKGGDRSLSKTASLPLSKGEVSPQKGPSSGSHLASYTASRAQLRSEVREKGLSTNVPPWLVSREERQLSGSRGSVRVFDISKTIPGSCSNLGRRKGKKGAEGRTNYKWRH